MTLNDPSPTRRPPRAPRLPLMVWVAIAALAAYAVVVALLLRSNPATPLRLSLDASPLLASGLAVKAHVAAALLAMAAGGVLLAAPKGRALHRTLGWTWVGLMTVAAVSSFFLHSLTGALSPIHAISAWVIVGLPMGIAAVRRRDIARHRKTMTGMYVGGMLVAGLFTFLPGRLMWDVVFTA